LISNLKPEGLIKTFSTLFISTGKRKRRREDGSERRESDEICLAFPHSPLMLLSRLVLPACPLSLNNRSD